MPAHTHTQFGEPAGAGGAPGGDAVRSRQRRALTLVLPLIAIFTVAEVVAQARRDSLKPLSGLRQPR